MALFRFLRRGIDIELRIGREAIAAQIVALIIRVLKFGIFGLGCSPVCRMHRVLDFGLLTRFLQSQIILLLVLDLHRGTG